MYPKCNNKECGWYMGDDFKIRHYLNGKCYFSNGKNNDKCPIKKKSNHISGFAYDIRLKKERCK